MGSQGLTGAAGHLHAVTFYESPESLSRIVAQFLGDGLAQGQPALMIATPEHRAAIRSALGELHFDADAAQASGDLLMLDAANTLTGFMGDGMPNAELFNQIATNALTGLCRGRKNCTVRAYGEMVDVLWKQGHDAAAIRVEMMWNRLATTHDFALLCGYAMGNFYKDAGRSAIRHQHTHVVSDHGRFLPAMR